MTEWNIKAGDACDRTMFPDESFDLTITSPPYNVGIDYGRDVTDDRTYEEYVQIFSRLWLRNCFAWSKPHGRLCLNIPIDINAGGRRAVLSDLTEMAARVGWRYKTTIFWKDGNMSKRTAWGSWMRPSAPHVNAPVEAILVMSKGEWNRPHEGDDQVTITPEQFKLWTWGLWEFGQVREGAHPAPFPLELPKRCIGLFSYLGDHIFDPFVGSGTTAVAALKAGRQTTGLDLQPEYCRMAEDRIRRDVGGLFAGVA